MTSLYRKLPLPFLLLLAAFATGCDDDPITEDLPPVEAVLVENLPADPIDASTDRPVGTGKYTFFSLRENRVVPNADSASTMWDLAFNGTTILTNSGVSGPGEGGAVVVAHPFEEVVEAPADGAFLIDAEGAPAVASSPAGRWYNYNPTTHVVTPVPGRTIVVRTADGRYAKLRILSYYKDNPATIDSESVSRYYTFEYLFQPDGSRSLRAE